MNMGKACGNPNCKVTWGIHEGYTCGSGRMCDNGFWEFPCPKCARQMEAEFEKIPDNEKKYFHKGKVWPYEHQDIAKLTREFQDEFNRKYGFNAPETCANCCCDMTNLSVFTDPEDGKVYCEDCMNRREYANIQYLEREPDDQ